MGLPAHEIFQDGGLSCALAAHDSDLRQIEVAALADGAECILEAVDQRDQLLHPAVAHRNGAALRHTGRQPSKRVLSSTLVNRLP